MVEENENNLSVNIPLPSSKKEIIFELRQNKEIKDLKNEVILLKQEVNDLKEKINNKLVKVKKQNIVPEKIKYEHNISNSKIIGDNEEYNERLKNWINPTRKIKAELLYRLSDNGDKFSTFHQLCD